MLKPRNRRWDIDHERACEQGETLRSVVRTRTKIAADEQAIRLGFGEPRAHRNGRTQPTDIQLGPVFGLKALPPGETIYSAELSEADNVYFSVEAPHSITEISRIPACKCSTGNINSERIEYGERMDNLLISHRLAAIAATRNQSLGGVAFLKGTPYSFDDEGVSCCAPLRAQRRDGAQKPPTGAACTVAFPAALLAARTAINDQTVMATHHSTRRCSGRSAETTKPATRP